MTSSSILPPPNQLEMPKQFTSWRDYQAQAVMGILDTTRRVVAQVCPTGFGKSLMYIAACHLEGKRAVVLTSTKGLQSQLIRDFGDMVTDIRGRNSYRCRAVGDGTTCDYGPCVTGWRCQYKDMGGCDYYDQLRRVQKSRLVITNYAYWMTAKRYNASLGDEPFGVLVCDEAHAAPDMVGSVLTVTLSRRRGPVSEVMPSHPESFTTEQWADWAARVLEPLEKQLAHAKSSAATGGDKQSRRLVARLKSTISNLELLAEMKPDEWAVDINDYTVSLSPVRPGSYCEWLLFQGIPKVILTSAFLCSKTLDLLGVRGNMYHMTEYPHSFPVENRRLLHIPTARMNAKSSAMAHRLWLSRIDQIIKGRLDRKGIIHTVSYRRRDFVLEGSKHKDYMVTNNPNGDPIEEVIQAFRRADPPRVLVSPVLSTGFDFPGRDCEYQIIGKIAYPDSRNAITKARTELDKDYPAYIAMQQLVQAVGRGVRSPTDQCETFVIDDNIRWFLRRHRDFAPDWFLAAYGTSETIPTPPAGL